ncbi:GNAT family N-acetyltransferase [Shewanella submarina]|uniref:GNAT family N-acetyltransferase n=1 Tax=Shewanella submarina TaxID=2016376 RepID=A0ABV7G5Q4_9GAMM|nr:GNAT family N-acetyltransferase [Shewanella submarina]MCL1038355.1 GNAT family N-acetyltransferase [Shewanella submarina]
MSIEIRSAIHADAAAVSRLMEANYLTNGGLLSAMFPESKVIEVMDAMPMIVAVDSGELVGFLMSSELDGYKEVPAVQRMLEAYKPTEGAYIYGPICVSSSHRGQGIAQELFAVLKSQVPSTEGVLFIRSDNDKSIKAHTNMGMTIRGEYEHDGVKHFVLSYF